MCYSPTLLVDAMMRIHSLVSKTVKIQLLKGRWVSNETSFSFYPKEGAYPDMDQSLKSEWEKAVRIRKAMVKGWFGNVGLG